MKILLTAPKISRYDAVSNDLLAMKSVLESTLDEPGSAFSTSNAFKNTQHKTRQSDRHNECLVYAQFRHISNIDYANETDIKKIVRNPENLLIYHHGVYWEEGKKLLKDAKCTIIFRYHNITPPVYYRKYNEIHEYACERGEEQTLGLIKNYPGALWLCASRYNAKDLNGVPGKQIFICPPFNKTEQWTKIEPDKEILGKLRPVFSGKTVMNGKKNSAEQKTVNLLFAGRISPNKGHLFLIDVLHSYVNNFSNNIKLHIIGGVDKLLEGYLMELKHKIKMFGLEENVEFTGEINDSKLLAYYTGCDFFICGSLHEGFLVPIAEAQYLKLPIIARAKAAIPETAGENQILLGDDPAEYAAAIHLIADNNDYRDFLVNAGYQNFTQRFSAEKITEAFVRFMKEAL